MVFLDTNILIYAYDPHDHKKHNSAKELLKKSVQSCQGVVSSQVIQEFCNVVLSKFTITLKPNDLNVILDEVLLPIWQHSPSANFYRGAIQLFQSNALSFYDALIVQAALDLGCDVLYSEDLQDGRKFGTLTVKNPFA